jgi:aldehyde:ferredoxin oxidoreductase
MYGITGKVLRVDLITQQINVDEFDELFYRKYLGGRNVGLYYLLNEMEAGVDPLGPDNLLIFSTGVATGAPLAGFSRHSVVAKSPLTGSFGEAEAGGFFGSELKFGGFDAVVVEGASPEPVYLWIEDGRAEIRDASQLWGVKTRETQEAIREEVGDPLARIAMIGPGGENLVRYACVINEMKYANGRNGLGAVMGSKKLKAVAVRGRDRPSFSDPDRVKEFARWFAETWRENPSSLARSRLGTAGGVTSLNADGILPTRNFRKGSFEGAEGISGENMRDNILVEGEGCYACPIRCKRKVKGEPPFETDPEYGGPEYETIGAFGSLCEVANISAISYANQLCNAYGLDTISTGCSIAFAMECFERGRISETDTGGMDLSFGNAEAMVRMVEMIALREGLGDILAEGVMRASEKIGGGSKEWALHVKGKEIPMHDPRGKTGLALQYATSPSGADHMQAAHDPSFERDVDMIKPLTVLEPVDRLSLGPEKVRMVKYLNLWWILLDVLDICKFTIQPHPVGVFTINQLPEIINAVTGWNTSLHELLMAAERGMNMAKLFNQREGFNREDDWIPERFFQPLEAGSRKGAKISAEKLSEALETFYGMMGWNKEKGEKEKMKMKEL